MSHKAMILSWLQSGKTITQRQAYQKPFSAIDLAHAFMNCAMQDTTSSRSTCQTIADGEHMPATHWQLAAGVSANDRL